MTTQLKGVNRDGLAGAIRFGCRTMRSVFDADDNDVPFFSSQLRPEAFLRFSAHHSESHVPGRHLNGLLAAEAAAPEDNADPEILAEAVAKHRRALMLSYSGSVPLPLNRSEAGPGGPTHFCPHNLREGFHGLYALARWADDDEAANLAERSIDAVRAWWHPGKGWDEAAIKAAGCTYMECQGFVHGEARMLGPLVKLHEATSSLKALRLAEDVVDKLTTEFYLQDGAFTQERFGTRHAHSVTCCLSSLAQFARWRQDDVLMGRVQAFYDNGLWQMRDAIGWSPEATQQTGSDHGEGNNTGDIVETALILGRHVDRRYDDDAERILRCHLLPSQLLDVGWVEEPDNPDGIDGLRDLGRRHQGAWGFPAPYGHQSVGEGRRNLSFNMDIVGGVVASLSEALMAASEFDEDQGHRVRLRLPHETDALKLEAPYGDTPDGDVLRLTLKRRGPLSVHLPAWVDRSRVVIADPVLPEATVDDIGIHIAEPPVDRMIHVRYPIPTQDLELTHHHDQPISVRLQGDRVEAMDNLGADLTFFPSFDDLDESQKGCDG